MSRPHALRVRGFDGKLSREHVAPQWLRTLFPNEGKVPHIKTFEGADGKPQPKEWEAYPFDLQKRVVCTPCNTTWMSRMEAEIKPRISPT